MTDEPLIPVTFEEFVHTLVITVGACKTRKLIRGTYKDDYNAKQIAEWLWQNGMRPFRKPPLPIAPASQYPGHNRQSSDDPPAGPESETP